MDYELTNVFTPIYKETGNIDSRFNEDMKAIYDEAGSEVFNGLLKFSEKKLQLENDYGKYAFKLSLAFLRRIDSVNKNEPWDSTTNRYKWRGRSLQARLREGLAELGFKPTNVSKIIGAAQFTLTLKQITFDGNYDFAGSPEEDQQQKRFIEWCKKLGVSSLYELARTDRPHCPWTSSFKRLQELSNNFEDIVPRKALESLRQNYPLNEDETRGRKGLKVFADEIGSSREQIPETQAEIQAKFWEYLARIDTDNAFVSPEFRAELVKQQEHLELFLGWLPSPTHRLKPTLSTLL